MVKIATSAVSGGLPRRGFVTVIPKAVVVALGGLEKGDRLEWHVENEEIIVRKAGAREG